MMEDITVVSFIIISDHAHSQGQDDDDWYVDGRLPAAGSIAQFFPLHHLESGRYGGGH